MPPPRRRVAVQRGGSRVGGRVKRGRLGRPPCAQSPQSAADSKAFEKCTHVSGVSFERIFAVARSPRSWACRVCGDTSSVWACLTCGQIGCGRYVKGHAKEHFQLTGHPLCIEVNSLIVHCYACDDFCVSEDASGELANLRRTFSEMSSQFFDESTTRSGRVIHPSFDATAVASSIQASKAAAFDVLRRKDEEAAATERLRATGMLGSDNVGWWYCDGAQSSDNVVKEEERDVRKARKTRSVGPATPKAAASDGVASGGGGGSRPGSAPAGSSSSTFVRPNDGKQQLGKQQKMAAPWNLTVETPDAGLLPDTFAVPGPPTAGRRGGLYRSRIFPHEQMLMTPRTPGPKLDTGLRNLGNTCFLNAVLQCLRSIPLVKDYFSLEFPILKGRLRRARAAAASADSEAGTPTSAGTTPCSPSVAVSSPAGFSQEEPSSPSDGPPSTPQIVREPTQECFEHVTSRKNKKNSGQTIEEKDTPAVEMQLCDEVYNLIRVLASGRYSVLSPHAILSYVWKVAPSFRGYQQQDGHEFLLLLLNQLSLELREMQLELRELELRAERLETGWPGHISVGDQTPPSIMSELFEGQYSSTVSCLVCGSRASHLDAFWDLSLDIPPLPMVEAKRARSSACARLSSAAGAGGKRKRKRKDVKDVKDEGGEEEEEFEGGRTRSVHLLDCLRSFVAVEQLDTQFFCQRCRCKQPSTKQITLTHLPKVIFLHLKAFQWNASFSSCTKLNVPVRFPVRDMLDLTRFTVMSPNTAQHNTAHSAPAAVQQKRVSGHAPAAPHSGTEQCAVVSPQVSGARKLRRRRSCAVELEEEEGGVELDEEEGGVELEEDERDVLAVPPPPSFDGVVGDAVEEEGLGSGGSCAETGGGGGPRARPVGARGEEERFVYRLTGLLVHHGSSPGSGHYTAACFDPEKGVWLHYNDSQVTRLTVSEVESFNGYVFMYSRCPHAFSSNLYALPPPAPWSGVLKQQEEC